jgi:ribonuclease P protein component
MNRKYSLKKNHDIDRLIKLKKSVGNRFYAVYYAQKDSPLPQIAVSVSKKIKTAVERNYEKRVIREILRNHIGECQSLQMLIVVKTTVRELSFAQKKEQISYLLRRIIKENQINEQ